MFGSLELTFRILSLSLKPKNQKRNRKQRSMKRNRKKITPPVREIRKQGRKHRSMKNRANREENKKKRLRVTKRNRNHTPGLKNQKTKHRNQERKENDEVCGLILGESIFAVQLWPNREREIQRTQRSGGVIIKKKRRRRLWEKHLCGIIVIFATLKRAFLYPG